MVLFFNDSFHHNYSYIPLNRKAHLHIVAKSVILFMIMCRGCIKLVPRFRIVALSQTDYIDAAGSHKMIYLSRANYLVYRADGDAMVYCKIRIMTHRTRGTLGLPFHIIYIHSTLFRAFCAQMRLYAHREYAHARLGYQRCAKHYMLRASAYRSIIRIGASSNAIVIHMMYYVLYASIWTNIEFIIRHQVYWPISSAGNPNSN